MVKKIILMALVLLLALTATGCDWNSHYNPGDNETGNATNSTLNNTDNSTESNQTIDLSPEYTELKIGYYDLNKLSVADSDNSAIIDTIIGIFDGYDIVVLNSIPEGSERLYKSFEEEGYGVIPSGEVVITYKERSGVTTTSQVHTEELSGFNSMLKKIGLTTNTRQRFDIVIVDSDKEYAGQALGDYENLIKGFDNSEFLLIGTTYADCYYYTDNGNFQSEVNEWYPSSNGGFETRIDTTLDRGSCAYNNFITEFQESFSVVESGVEDEYLEFESPSEITSFKPVYLKMKIFDEEEE